MVISIAYLGPTGTNAETAALAYLDRNSELEGKLLPTPNIARALQSVIAGKSDLAIVPIENSIEGSVRVTLDTLWELERLNIQQALVLPISHALLSVNPSLNEIEKVYSHPQALAQCQNWLQKFLPDVELIETNSTTEILPKLQQETRAAAISAPRASQLYHLPILASDIGDYPDNCTQFWVVGRDKVKEGSIISLAFSIPDEAGALLKPIEIFAKRGINLSRIESRPTRRSFGEYIFFIDLEGNANDTTIQEALAELSQQTQVLKILGNYHVINIDEINSRIKGLT
jgi:prephenate dehydratase